ncbi:adenylosuccinate synthase [Paenibacillus sp. IB182496]|uniref:Adenylosuccinate synthetase n=1 Tax=Paenibacillus sabuli TaxID=2772509 RepID=A0A927BZB5_9BACL|nr:adenylosuccinate synthase [Paenibacillus sabuli]MBD2848063.1 adenylosuccinate synthase [Paenibacillus sabuli]
MSITAIVGGNWGDEGKGKMTDALASEAEYVVRYQGGSNAGHTVIGPYGKVALHLLPSGVLHPHVHNVIGPGVALDLDQLFAEYEMLRERGIPEARLTVSHRAQIVLPVHRLLDELEEQRLGDSSYGSTRRGIAPFYADKYAKLGVQVADLYDHDRLLERLQATLVPKNVLLQHLYGRPPLQAEAWLAHLLRQAERLRPLVGDTTELLGAAARQAPVLLEGQLGALRDPDHGIYPYVTSSSTLAGYGTVGAGLPPGAISRVITVVKAYASCVGAGPFVSELSGEEADELRRRGGDAGEFGATTGRPRRVGWFDAVATRYGCAVQGATDTALTNLDVLGYLDAIPVCTAYRLADGTRTTQFPVTAALAGARPILDYLPGWQCDITGARRYDELPEAARHYVRFIEQATGRKVSFVSNGPHREQLIAR